MAASCKHHLNGKTSTTELLRRLEVAPSCSEPKDNSTRLEPDIALIHDNMSYHDDVSDIRLLDDEETISLRSHNARRNYIPSPLTTPRRMTRKLGDQITNSPILNRARRRFETPQHNCSSRPSCSSATKSETNIEATGSIPSAPDSSSNGSSSGSTSTSKPSTGLLSFLTSWRRNSTNGNKKNYGKNLFLDPRMHNPDYEDGFEMHQFSDSGRIANRYDNMRWDVWTSMGENVLEYDGVLLDEGEDDPYFEDGDCSSSEDEFLEIPLNDRFFYKH